MKYFNLLLVFVYFSTHTASAQTFTHADTLRGSNNGNRNWWDVLKYDITLTPDFTSKTISGKNTITAYLPMLIKDVNGKHNMQIDLQDPLIIDSVISYNQGRIKENFAKTDKNVWIITFDKLPFNPTTFVYMKDNEQHPNIFFTIYYHGTPREAVKPPWDGGLIWKKDSLNRPWISVACQGLGASVWYPCKDIQSDEPDLGATVTLIVPDTLMAISNGRLIHQNKSNGLGTYTWNVKNPINNYDISFYIGKYAHWSEYYGGEKGPLSCDYWVLDYNLPRAKEQFKQVPKMLKAFEHWYGPYPFYEDGYKLVEAPHLGMEHQSAVAYGNGFKNGYRSTDLSGTGEGLKWDFIIVHESGHEWFGNNITSKDIADMWIHESFTNYSETLFTDYWFGKEAGQAYVVGTRKRIKNDAPIIGKYGVNNEGSGDMYYKGGNMLNMIRLKMNDDLKFRYMLRGLNTTFYHQTVTTQQIEDYMTKFSGIQLKPLFDLYLRSTQPPTFTDEDFK
jgi:aminopeptidase N